MFWTPISNVVRRRCFQDTNNSLDTNWVSCNSTQFWHYLSGYSVRFHRLRAQSYKTAPPSPQMPISGTGCYQYFWPTSYKSEVPTTPSLSCINLLEWLTELRKLVYLLDHQFIVKVCNSGTARWKRCIGQDMGKGTQSFQALPEHTTLPESSPVHQFRNSLNPGLKGFIEISLLRYDWLNHWPLAVDSTAPVPSLEVRGVGLKVPTL